MIYLVNSLSVCECTSVNNRIFYNIGILSYILLINLRGLVEVQIVNRREVSSSTKAMKEKTLSSFLDPNKQILST